MSESDVAGLARAWWVEASVMTGSERGWAEDAWDDMGGSEPTEERVDYEEMARVVVASGWLAGIKAEALREAADEVEDACAHTTDPCFCGSASWLRERADRIEHLS